MNKQLKDLITMKFRNENSAILLFELYNLSNTISPTGKMTFSSSKIIRMKRLNRHSIKSMYVALIKLVMKDLIHFYEWEELYNYITSWVVLYEGEDTFNKKRSIISCSLDGTEIFQISVPVEKMGTNGSSIILGETKWEDMNQWSDTPVMSSIWPITILHSIGHSPLTLLCQRSLPPLTTRLSRDPFSTLLMWLDRHEGIHFCGPLLLKQV